MALLTDGLRRFQALDDHCHTAIAQALLGSMLQESGNLESATEYVAASLAGHAQHRGRWFVTYNLMVLVRVLVAREQWNAAARMLGAAQAIGDAVSSAISASTYEELGAAISEHLTAERFTAAWAEGHALTFDQAVAAALALATPAKPHPDTAPQTPSGTAPLTRREREIAVLLARGDTDRQIADALFITVGTVGVHVHNILRKLGLHSRVQVASWFARQAPSDRDTD